MTQIPAKHKILIVDDDLMSLEMLIGILKEEYAVLTARNGNDALNLLQHDTPDLILLDIVMPEMDGYAVFERIKQIPELGRVPVLFLSCMSEQECEVRGFKMGASDYITKPYNPHIVRLRIKNHLLLKTRYDQVTDRMKAQHELAAERIHLRTLINTLPDFIWLKDEQGRYLACNHRFETYFGALEADIVGKTDYDFVDRKLADFFRQHDMKAIAAGGPVINEESITLADGSHELLETIKSPMFGQDGCLIGVLGVARNITQLRRAHDELLTSEEQYRKLFSEMMSAMLVAEVIFDETGAAADYRLLQANPAVSQLTGLDSTEYLGKTGSELSLGWPDEVLKRYYEVALTGKPYQYTRYNPKFGQHFEVKVFSPRKGQFALLFNDITEQKQNEARLLAAVEAAKAADQAKSHFLTTVAHEFRTPLGLLSVNTGILKNYGTRITPVELESQLDHISQSVTRLSWLVESVLAFNRSGAENLVLHPEMITISPLCTELAAGVQTLFGNTHNLQVQVADTCGTIWLDEQLFRQSLENLLVNACRYTPEGGMITLEARRSDHQLIVSVSDTGIGIPEEDQPYVFEPFYQVGNIGNKRGLGLGLSIVQQSVTRMGGTVSMKSMPGSGTVITLQLPLDETATPERESACTPS